MSLIVMCTIVDCSAWIWSRLARDCSEILTAGIGGTHQGATQIGLCAELAKIHANLVARRVKGNFVDFTAKYGLGQGVNAKDVPLLRWVVMYVTHAGLDVYKFRSRLIYDEKQDQKVRIPWRVMLRGIAEFLRFVDKLFEKNIFHLDVSDDNLRYKLDHAILENDQTIITHLHFLLIGPVRPVLKTTFSSRYPKGFGRKTPQTTSCYFTRSLGVCVEDEVSYPGRRVCMEVFVSFGMLQLQPFSSYCNHSRHCHPLLEHVV